MSDIIHIGMSGLMAYKSAITIASNNIANANTPYYSRRSIDLAAAIQGGGVTVADVRRIYDQVASHNAREANCRFSEVNKYLEQLKDFEPFLDDSNINIGKFISDSLATLEQLNTSPNSIQQRNLFLNQLKHIATQFHSVDSEIHQKILATQQATDVTINQANNLLLGIADINKSLATATGDDRLGLLDQQEGMIQSLSKYLNFTVHKESSGLATIALSNGMTLVMGQEAVQLGTVPTSQDASMFDIVIKNQTYPIPITPMIQTGELASYIHFRENVLNPTEHALNRLSLAFADAFNQQNKLGMDLNGDLGGNIFGDINAPNSMINRIIINSNNTGSAQMEVAIADVSQLKTSNYQLSVLPGNQYLLTRLSDNTVVSSGALSGSFPQQIAVDGFQLSINSGTLMVGDQYMISPLKNAAASMGLELNDASLLALAWPVMASPNGQNTGQGAIKVTSINDTTNAAFSLPKQLNPPIKIAFITATSYQIVNANTNAIIEGPITYDPAAGATVFPTPGAYDPGYRVSLSGVMQSGDAFDIAYNTKGEADNSNGLVMSNIYRKGILEGGELSFTQGYNKLSGDVSVEVNNAKTRYDVASVLKEQADQKNDEISGVSLEEESMNLAQFQQAYQASAQVLEVAKVVLNTILEIARR